MKTYSEKLRDPRWQKKRLQVLERDGFKCESCKDTESELHVHHVYYSKNRHPWEYPNFALTTLCKECHQLQGERYDDEEDGIPGMIEDWERAIDFVTSSRHTTLFREVWDVGCAIGMAEQRGVPYETIMKTIVETVNAL